MTSLLAALRVGAIVFAVSLGACFAAEGPPNPLPPAGSVLEENSAEMGGGFREVAQSVVNLPGAFEGVGHFVFVYFHEEKVCQCGRGDVVVSPDGSVLIYTDVGRGKLMLFRASSRKRVELTQEFVGYPVSATWNFPAKQAVVTLSLGSKKSITVSL